jgi:asparagine synthase (glutamine-hydrolysing)
MAHSLETRVPFMDNDLVEFATKLPMNMKIRKISQENRIDENVQVNKKTQYFNKTNDGKLLLRKTMSKYTASNITQREKQGFSAPDATWFRGDSIEFVKKILLNQDSKLYSVFNFKVVEELLESHFSGNANRRLLIWSLLYLDEYLS